MLLMLSMSAFAWDFEPVQLSAAGADDVDVSADLAAWLSGGTATITDHAGVEVWSGASDASQLALVDFDDNGVTDLLALCGPSGLSQVQLDSGATTILDSEACTGLLEIQGSLVAQTDSLAYWSSRGGPTLDESEVRDTGLPGADLIAYTTDPPGLLKPSLVIAVAGRNQVFVYQQQDPPIEIDLGSPVRGLAADDTWIWASTDTETVTLQQAGERGWTRMPPQVVLTQADVSGDGALDVIGGSPDGVFVETGAWLSLRREDTDIEHVAAVRGETCATAIVAGATGVHLLSTDCGDDVDGDGVSSQEGDCHDGDPAILPGAAETCDGADENCNGHIDDVGVVVEGSLEADEGMGSNRLVARPICPGGAMIDERIEVAGGDENLRCDLSPDEGDGTRELSCAAGDDGDFIVEIRMGGDTPAQVPLKVNNVAPRLPNGEAEFSISTAGGSRIWVEDYDEDVIVTVIDGPRWFEVLPDGTVVNPAPRDRRWDATLRFDDQDGGITEVEVELVGTTPSTSCVESSCSTSGPAVVWPFSLVLLAFARRRTP